MSYARPSPHPGEIYDRYGPPRPPTGNAYSEVRSEASGARPSRPPPHQYPMAGPSYRSTSSRPVQRSHDDVAFEPLPRQSSRRPPYNNSYSKSSDCADFDYYHNPPRRTAMTEDRSRNFRTPPSSVRPHGDARDHPSRPPPDRDFYSSSEGRRASDDHHFDSEEGRQALENNQDSDAAQGSWSWNNIKKTVWGAKDSNQSLEEDQVRDEAPLETQNTLWTKLTTVGATFQKKIHGEEGYASDASDYQGESHLIRIMKKYYTEKAESAHDLPDWLFTQAELKEAHSRKTGPSSERRPGRYDELEEENDYRREDSASSGRGRLTDIYDSVDHDRGQRSRNGSSAQQSFDSGYGSSSNTPRRRGRYDDSRSELSDSQPPSLGRNRLAPVNNDQSARYPGSDFNNYNKRPVNDISPYKDGRGVRRPSEHYSKDPRGHDPRGYDPRGYDSRGYDPRGYDSRGYDPRGYDPRGYRNAPIRGAPGPSPYTTPTVVDYFRPSGQDDRYPMPKTSSQRSFAH